ncbi:MAG: hypothetical protein UU70_C0032G0013, partial [Candidatus Yanofskybacteria bacterium GW2011_GWA1_41_6]
SQPFAEQGREEDGRGDANGNVQEQLAGIQQGDPEHRA